MHKSAFVADQVLSQLPPEGLVAQPQRLTGQYVIVFIAEANGPTLRGCAVAVTTNAAYHANMM